MNKQCFWLSIDNVLLGFGNVVRDIVNHVHVQVIRGHFELFCKCLEVKIKNKKNVHIKFNYVN